MPDAHYELPELAALYDLESGWSADRDFYRSLAGSGSRRVLEVGCGTGLIARAIAADGHHVTGVDPAPAMLEQGRVAPGGDKVRWIEGFAQSFVIDHQFDYAFMTGHAFQVLLEDVDILAALANIGHHLKKGATFAFETRNPALPWESMFEHEVTLQTEDGSVVVDWRVEWRRGDLIRFHSHYQLADGERISDSTLRFADREQIEAMLVQSGFEICAIYGDWDRSPFHPAHSREIIFLATWPG